MIQKIRSYLLDNEDHKDSIGWYVVIIMLFPVVGMIFQYRKSVSTYVGTVNSKKIEKSIFNIKLFEQAKLMENINKMFGEEQGAYFFEMLFQGKTLEQFVLSGEIRRLFLQQKFEKLISGDSIASEYILLSLKSKSLDKIKSNIGELPFLLVTGQLKPNALGSLNVDINKVDTYCQEVFQVNLLKNIFLMPLATIEKLSFVNYPSLPFKINFAVYFLSSKQIETYRKGVDIKTITDAEMRSVYDLGFKEGRFDKPRTYKFIISTYSIKDKKNKKDKNLKASVDKSELNEINDTLADIWKKLNEGGKAEIDSVIKGLQEELVCVSAAKSVDLVFDNNKNVVSSSMQLSKSLKDNIVNYAIKNQNKEKQEASFFVAFIEEGNLFFIEEKSLSALEHSVFDEVKALLIDDIVAKRADGLIREDMEIIRYALEAKEKVALPLWNHEDKVFSRELDNKKEVNIDRSFHDLVNKKISSGGLREGNTFLDFNEDFYRVYYVSGLTYEVEDRFVVRKDQFYNKEVFIESLERYAKIEMND
jgi:hypothetical protein